MSSDLVPERLCACGYRHSLHYVDRESSNYCLIAQLRHRASVAESERDEALAESTRGILRATLKGYVAGESDDGKHWRQRAEAAEAKLAAVEQEREALKADRDEARELAELRVDIVTRALADKELAERLQFEAEHAFRFELARAEEAEAKLAAVEARGQGLEEQVVKVQQCAEALRIVDFNERKQEFFCRACRYRDPLIDGNKLHDDNCPWVDYVQAFGVLRSMLASPPTGRGPGEKQA